MEHLRAGALDTENFRRLQHFGIWVAEAMTRITDPTAQAAAKADLDDRFKKFEDHLRSFIIEKIWRYRKSSHDYNILSEHEKEMYKVIGIEPPPHLHERVEPAVIQRVEPAGLNDTDSGLYFFSLSCDCVFVFFLLL